ncbi:MULTISPECIES: adenylate kinase DNA topology modulator [Priestia]|uniref:adenylate kinase DNA topology modulator n=1 Tax=Priestia TaxID=2800373 RepID=UPI001E40C9A6|nr:MULTISPECIES: adenylate kinase DNA topology modulator [Priestia]MCM3796754.1 adenylate kinase DNA topology modulator [Priestia megaterium]
MYKIVIFGNCCSGKTTLATQLGEKLNIPIHHLDLWFREPKMRKISQIRQRKRYFKKKLERVLNTASWIVEGWGYVDTYDVRFSKADIIIFLDVVPQESKERFLIREQNKQMHTKITEKLIKQSFYKIDKFHEENRPIILDLFQKYEGQSGKSLFPIARKYNLEQLLATLRNGKYG